MNNHYFKNIALRKKAGIRLDDELDSLHRYVTPNIFGISTTGEIAGSIGGHMGSASDKSIKKMNDKKWLYQALTGLVPGVSKARNIRRARNASPDTKGKTLNLLSEDIGSRLVDPVKGDIGGGVLGGVLGTTYPAGGDPEENGQIGSAIGSGIGSRAVNLAASALAAITKRRSGEAQQKHDNAGWKNLIKHLIVAGSAEYDWQKRKELAYQKEKELKKSK